MAARNFSSNRIYNWHLFPVQLDARVTIGASGAPTLVTSSTVPGSSPSANQAQSRGIKSITRLAAGQYQIQLEDNFSSMYDFKASFTAPLAGSPVAGGAFVIGTVYQILTTGTTTQAQWETAGVPSGITAQAGVVFKAATVGAGTGTVSAMAAPSASYQASVMGTPDLMLNKQPFTPANGGGYINFMTVGPTTPGGGGDPAPAPADPDNGTTMYIKILLSNSSIS